MFAKINCFKVLDGHSHQKVFWEKDGNKNLIVQL